VTNQDSKWDTVSIYSVLWCGIGILFFKGDYLLGVLCSATYIIAVSLVSALQPVREKYPYFTICVIASFIYVWGTVYLFQLLGLNNLWRTLAVLPLMCLAYWFGARKVRPMLMERKGS